MLYILLYYEKEKEKEKEKTESNICIKCRLQHLEGGQLYTAERKVKFPKQSQLTRKIQELGGKNVIKPNKKAKSKTRLQRHTYTIPERLRERERELNFEVRKLLLRFLLLLLLLVLRREERGERSLTVKTSLIGPTESAQLSSKASPQPNLQFLIRSHSRLFLFPSRFSHYN